MGTIRRNVLKARGGEDMAELTRAFAKEVVERFNALPPDAERRWGTLTREGVIEHLVGTFEYSMKGDLETFRVQVPLKNRIIGFVMINGFAHFPKGVKIKTKEGEAIPAVRAEGGTERLGEVMEEFLSCVEDGSMTPSPHPFFGALRAEQWAKFHLQHLKHHMRQFGA
jgi:hypothetical protein